MSENDSQYSLAWRLLREPMAHFVALAALLFGVYGAANFGRGELLELSQQEIDARVFLREMELDRELTPEERDQITALHVEERILAREARRLNLDNDARIHDMLAQKMRHVLSGAVIQPDEAELRAYFDANRERYTTPELVSADELVFDEEPAAEALTALAGGGEPEAILALEAGTVSPLLRVNRLDLSNIFNADISDRVFAAAAGEWIGPHVGNRGQHWLRVTEREAARSPNFEEILDRVRFDWIATEEDRLLQIEVDRLWEEYVVVITE